MYTLQWMKFNERWRRLAWRLNVPTYATWVGSTVITLAVMRTVVSHAGPADTREWADYPGGREAAPAHVVRGGATAGCDRQRFSPECRPHTLPAALHTHHLFRARADQARVAADGTYMRRKYAEVYDNPLYR
jgi:hypothetical protein